MTKLKWIPALIALCMVFSSTAISLPTMHNAMIAEAASGEWYDCFFFTVNDGEATIESCSGVGRDLVIPSQIRNYPVTRIGGFNDAAALRSVTIPDGVTTILGNAFSGCTNLSTVTIPDTVTTIDSNAVSWTASES